MMEWKAAIHEYVDRLNRAESDCSGAPLETCVRDREFLLMLEERLRRVKVRGDIREATPLRQETRLRITRFSEAKHEIRAELMLRKTMLYRQGGRRFREDRLERESLVLRREKGGWRIVTVLPDVSERAADEQADSRPDVWQGDWRGDWQGGWAGDGGDADGAAADPIGGMAAGGPGGGGRSGSRAPGPWGGARPQEGPRPGRPYLHPSVTPVRPIIALRGKPYVRRLAVEYADRWWDAHNPEYRAFDVDCTNYVSQCLFAGGAPMTYTGKRNSGWWYRHGNGDDWSFSWTVSNSLQWYLAGARKGLTAQRVRSASELEPGDVIFYDWDGDGHFQHSTIVTAKDANGQPLVNAHTVNSRWRYWDYRDSYAWSEQTKYRFYHISDEFF